MPGSDARLTSDLLSPASAADQMNLVLLRIAYPGFRFTQCLHRSRLCWVAVRKDSSREGVHTVVTGDLDELQAALADTPARGRYPFQLAERLTRRHEADRPAHRPAA